MRVWLMAFFALFMFIAGPAMALQLDSSGLTDQQIAEIEAQAAQLRAQNLVVGDTVSIAELTEYADLGKKYGVALAEVAKELGKSVDEIMNTNVGKVAVFLIVWKVVGEDFLGVGGGTFWFMIMLPTWFYFFHRLVLRNRDVKEKFDKETGKLTERTVDRIDWEQGATGGMAVILGVVLVLICGAGFIMIF